MSLLLEQYLSYCAPLRGSDRYHKWCFLGVVSALLERRVFLDQGRVGILFPNTYTFLVGPPATGKGFAMDLALDFYHNTRGSPMPLRSPSKITQAAMYEHLSKNVRCVRISGQKPYLNAPMFLNVGELGQAMEDFGGGLLTNELIDFYDSKSLFNEVRKFTLSGGYITLKNPSMVLLAGTNADFLQSAQQSRIVNSGLSSRIVFVVETKLVDKQFDEVLVDMDLRAAIIDQLEKIYKFTGIMTMHPETRALYVAQGAIAQQSSYDSLAHFYKNYFGRKPMHILKVAMLLTAMNLRHEILPETFNEAVDLINAIEPDMVNAFGVRSIEKDPDLMQQILNLIPEEPGWTHKSILLRALIDSGRFIPDNGALEGTLKGLATSGVITRRAIGDDMLLSKCSNALQRLKAVLP